MADHLVPSAKRLFENLTSDLKQLSIESRKKHQPVKEAVNMADHLVPSAKRLFENLTSDLKQLSIESRKKHQPVKEASEACMLKLRMLTQKSRDFLPDLLSSSAEVVQPFIMGCDSKNPKMVLISLTAIQRMIEHQVVSAPSADNIIKTLWNLMNSGVEELKLLQTTIVMITTNSIVQHESLAKALVLAFRLYFTKDSATINTAGATVRQLVTVVYDRVLVEDGVPSQQPLEKFTVETMKGSHRSAPESLRPCAQDGFMLFQDLCQLVNADNPIWLIGITEMTRTFGLELLESVMSGYPQIFQKHEEFAFLLKERVCPLVIKLFSPTLKYKQGLPPTSNTAPGQAERPYFPITMRLIRIVASLIKDFYSLLSTECEIFLSLLIKFMDIDKPVWQRCLSLEVLMRICSDAKLIRSFVESYDMKEHSTKIFNQMVNAIGSFVQTLFASAISTAAMQRNEPKIPDTQGAPPALLGGIPVGGGITPQPAFVYKGVWIPLIMGVPQTTLKPMLLEMMDKLEPPSIPEGYALTLGFACLLEITKSIELNVTFETKESGEEDSFVKSMRRTMVESAWCGVLASLSLLLDASTDEQATESILKAEEMFVMLAGSLDRNTARDAFVTALCKAAMPPHYALSVLSSIGKSINSQQEMMRSHVRVSSLDLKSANPEDSIDKSQVVAIGTPLPTPGMSQSLLQQQVMLTAKNISCMRAVLSLAHCHGAVLGHSWDIILTALQHLVWILGLKAVSGGQLKTEKAAAESQSSVITTAIMADLPVISHMLTKLFESSKLLDDVAVHHLVNALCKLSNEAMELAFNNREPSLFAVAKIHETGLANLHRIEVLWRPLTGHLLEVCQHPHAAMRACGVEAVSSLVLSALQHDFNPPLFQNERLLALLLSPLKELTNAQFIDVRLSQMECSLQILQNCGETLASGWMSLLSIIGDGASLNGDEEPTPFATACEVVVRTAFQGMQLIVTDFLPIISCKCLMLCVEMAAKFGLQKTELNVSLTAIGLLWNITDFFYQQRVKLAADITREADPTLTSSDQLWLCLYSKFGELCVDSRPAVRKSAGQTLFSTIAAHGDLLQLSAWEELLWKVLFPLLDHVRENLDTAPTQRETSGPEANILMHHSRDTASKQWSETQVLIMAGVARVFSSRKSMLQELDAFPRAWGFMLQYIEKAAVIASGEVSVAALKSFHELVLESNGADKEDNSSLTVKPQKMNRDQPNLHTHSHSPTMWIDAWRVWLSIGLNRTTPPKDKSNPSVPSQVFLCHLMQIFPKIFQHLHSHFVTNMFKELCQVLDQSLLVPLAGDTSPFLVPTNYDSSMSPVQEAVLQSYDCIIQSIDKTQAGDRLYPALVEHLMRHCSVCVNPPAFGVLDIKPVNSAKGLSTGFIASDMTEFTEKCVSLGADLYKRHASIQSCIEQNTLAIVIKNLHILLQAKNGAIASSLWKIGINSLLDCLKAGLPLAYKHGSEFTQMWPVLTATLADFLFPSIEAPDDQSLAEFKEHELLDCRVVEVVQVEILPNSGKCPKDFIANLVQLLNRGSVLSQQGAINAGKVRHSFTQKCFETLLKFSFTNPPTHGPSATPISQVAVTALLIRCAKVIEKYVQDMSQSNGVPLPRSQVNEVTSSIKAVATLITSLKSTTNYKSVDAQIWSQILDLYPLLVSCIHSKCEAILLELETTLKSYSELLQHPHHAANSDDGSTNGL